MNSKMTSWQPELSMMNEERVRQFHQSALTILVEVGLNVHHQEMRTLLDRSGAKIGHDNRVFLTEQLVSQALETVQKDVVVYNRQGQPSMPLGSHQSYFGTGSDLLYTYNYETGQQRKSTLDDVARSARLCDALEEIDFVMSFALPADVPNEDTETQQYSTILQNTIKPVIMTSYSGIETLKRLHEIACLVAGGEQTFRKKPNYVMYGQFVSPLEHDSMALERLIFCADNRIPLIYVPTIMSGATGPITLYGSLVLALSETLAGLVMHQLQNPGAPFITGACVGPLDMKTGIFPYGSAEWRINDLVMAEMSRYYGIPVFGTGGTSDSKLVDAQAGAEYASSLLIAALAGTNLIHDVGYLNSGLTGSLESIVLGAEIIRWVKRYIGGIDISRETLAKDVISEVGPAGEFLSHDHTYQNLSQTVWNPIVADHKDFDSWVGEGSREYASRALEFARTTLKNHKTKTLDPVLKEEILKI
jgi:trimethylamine--corrinoid protein Co-methyltransferase